MKKMILVLVAGAVLGINAGAAFANLPGPSRSIRAIPANPESFGLAGSADYQIGSEWGKTAVTPEMFAQQTPEFARAAKATAAYGGATAFYLGKFNGKHLMGTNHHVQPDVFCHGSFKFPILNKSYQCKQVLGHWSDADFALVEISVPAQDEQLLAPIGRSFDFEHPLVPGQLLLTIGFGIANNPFRQLMANQDSDCKVFSQQGDFHFMADPDELNPGDYKAWSFANGCDVSHGDSGSAMVDRVTGYPIGIIWTGRIPKSRETQNSANIDGWYRTQDPKIWTELSYAVPATKIRDVLRAYVTSGPQIPRDVVDTIAAFVH